MQSSKVWILIGILVIISSAGTAVSLHQMYRSALRQEATRLEQMVAASVTLIEAVARFDAQHSGDVAGGARAATLSQVVDGLSRLHGFGETGEFLVGERRGVGIALLYSDRQSEWGLPDLAPKQAVAAAAPMQAALHGTRGSLVGRDYRDQKVLAAYAPIQDLDLGVVAKIDLAEIRRPFFRTALISAVFSLALVTLGAVIIQKISHPLIQQYQAQAAQLEEKELKTRSIIDTAADGIITIDSRGAITAFNAAAGSIFGYTPEEVLHRNISILQPPEVSGRHGDYIRRYLDTGERRIIGVGREVEGVHKSGRRIPIHLSVSEVVVGGQVSFTGILRDISKEKRYEADLKQAKTRAESADRLKSAFLASMSHEIRTPLNAIIGFTGILLQEIVGPLNQEQRKQLGMVQDSGNHLLSLINDILDLSKIEAGQLTLQARPLNMDKILAAVIENLSPLAAEKGLGMQVAEGAGGLRVRGDRRRVEQILINLIGNALKFTESGGLSIDFSRSAGFLATRIRDTGIGITAAELDHIFEKFHQVETTLSRRYAGTGLGLSICKRLVEMMGGTISATSEGLGKGSTFTFTLPLAAEEGAG